MSLPAGGILARQGFAMPAFLSPHPIPAPAFLTCRQARLGDIEALGILEEDCFPDNAMSKRQFRRHILNERARFYVAIDKKSKNIAGYCLILHHARRGARIYSFAVARPYRKQGVGRVLLDKTICAAKQDSATKLILEVSQHNRAARALYEKAGFTLWKKTPDYYGKGRHALKMLILLPGRKKV